ncbi:hypothetical protein [Kamptonema formosum]|nr:hypothetical protein [Oscillatoria sp. PCC 10802]
MGLGRCRVGRLNRDRKCWELSEMTLTYPNDIVKKESVGRAG